MNPEIQLNTEDYRQHTNIKESFEFYMDKFIPHPESQKLYDDMNDAEKANFKQIFTEHYGFLGISIDKLNENDVNETHCFQMVTAWLYHQEMVSYLSDVANNIVNAHREHFDRSLVNLDRNIRTENQEFIKEKEKKNDVSIECLKAWGQTNSGLKLR